MYKTTKQKMNKSNQKNSKNHKKNNNHRNHQTFGQKAADKITAGMGSWKFLIIQSCILVVWIILNVLGWLQHWDPFPFILLNLMLSFQAAYTAPIIMMSQNRTTEMDRKKVEIDLAMDRKTDRDIIKIQKQLNRLENNKLKRILDILESK